MATTVTDWIRLEPITRSEGLEGGLRAEVHDPLWLLARQWQLGEFWGSDTGSPAHAVVQMECTPITRYSAGGITTRLQRPEPLEMLVEREPVRDDSVRRPALAAEAGLHLLRLLDPTGAAGYRAALIKNFPLRPQTPSAPPDSDTQRFLGVMAGRVPDGALLAAVVRAVRTPLTLTTLNEQLRTRVSEAMPVWQAWLTTVPTADRRRVDRQVVNWLAWYDSLFSEPNPVRSASAWVPDRLEYAAAVAAHGREGEIVLSMPEYTDGDLDWFSFDVLTGGTLGADRSDLAKWPWVDPEGESVRRTVIPALVRFPGMPASRYWEFEDARVDFGAVAVGAQQLAHLLLVEFALIYGDDWFIIPVDLPVGSLARIQWVVVTDTFGGRTLVPSARAVDRKVHGDSLPWDMFGLAADRRRVAGASQVAPDALFLPPTLGTSLHGPVLEDILLMRDEMANMVWAVERVIESPIGRPFDRVEASNRARQAEPDGAASLNGGAATLRYHLATNVPDHWLPLLPERISPNAPAIRFRLGNQPLGRLLAPPPINPPLRVQDEEIPREGARVTRAYQYARWIDGQTYVWMGRRKGVGRGEGSSGLRFDVLDVT